MHLSHLKFCVLSDCTLSQLLSLLSSVLGVRDKCFEFHYSLTFSMKCYWKHAKSKKFVESFYLVVKLDMRLASILNVIVSTSHMYGLFLLLGWYVCFLLPPLVVRSYNVKVVSEGWIWFALLIKLKNDQSAIKGVCYLGIKDLYSSA